MTSQIDLVKLLGVYKFLRGEDLSYWVRPTTADIGIRAFGKNKNDLLREMTLGMQSILLAPNQDMNGIKRKTARWEISHDGTEDILIVKWLDEAPGELRRRQDGHRRGTGVGQARSPRPADS